MNGLTRLANSSTVDDVVTILERDGGVIIEDFLDADVLDEIGSELMPRLNAKPTGDNEFSGLKTRRMSALFAYSRRMADIATHPLYLPAAERIVNKPVSYWTGEYRHEMLPGLRIGATQIIQIGPGQPAQTLHRDDWVFLWRHPTSGREARLQIMIAMSEFTAANGGTVVIPGSHTWDDERIPRLDEALSTEMKPGSALIFLGSLYHGGGANRTKDQYRTGFGMGLDAGNIRQEENMYLAMPAEIVASYPEQIQRLLGWSVNASNYMGWVEIDGRMADPIELLRR